jgi:hypothetical protein
MFVLRQVTFHEGSIIVRIDSSLAGVEAMNGAVQSWCT